MDGIERLASTVVLRPRTIGVRPPARSVVAAVLRTVHTVSLIPEEGRFVNGSVTCANPKRIGDDEPSLLRADYPSFSQLRKTLAFTPATFAKLARAVDKWSGSVAVWGTTPQTIRVWGIVDQLVGTNVALNRESLGGFGNPGLFTVIIERAGDLTVYHSRRLIGALRAQEVVLGEVDALNSEHVLEKVHPSLKDTATAICRALPKPPEERFVALNLFGAWLTSIARICIGLRRLGFGGTLLLTPRPAARKLSVLHDFTYDRLRNALALLVLDETYYGQLKVRAHENKSTGRNDLFELFYAQADKEDRQDEVNGAVKLVTSLAALDGALLLTPDLVVKGFGVKIGPGRDVKAVLDGASLADRKRRPKQIDVTRFGTRHASVLRYCRSDSRAIGVIISQDGHVRLVLTMHRRLVMWDKIQLLHHITYTARDARDHREHRKNVRALRVRGRNLGYSRMPKTFEKLMRRQSRK